MALNLVCAVLDRGPARLSDMAVLLAIADSADKDTGECWPSQRTIAARSRQTDRSVRNVLERLRADGWLTWKKRDRANGSRASSVYTVNLAKLGETPRNHVPAPRNDVPAPPEPRSDHAPEPRSALEPSHQIEPSRASLRPRPARHGAHRSSVVSEGLASADASGFDVGSLGRFERSQLQGGKSVLIGGRLVKPGSTEAVQWLAALRTDAATPDMHGRNAEKGAMQ